jgi:hypothetical protein
MAAVLPERTPIEPRRTPNLPLSLSVSALVTASVSLVSEAFPMVFPS